MPLDKNELESLLDSEEIAYIATTKENGDPHVVPIWFVLHEGKIFFETDLDTVKFKNIKKRNRIALCFGGKDTYLLSGSVRWFKESEAEVPFRKLLWEKYPKHMQDDYITDNTLIFEVIPEESQSWHYAPNWD